MQKGYRNISVQLKIHAIRPPTSTGVVINGSSGSGSVAAKDGYADVLTLAGFIGFIRDLVCQSDSPDAFGDSNSNDKPISKRRFAAAAERLKLYIDAC